MNPIPILFLDKNIIVVNKPVGVSIHNNEDAQNLLQLLESQIAVKKLFPVHRLDKETSGVQILALNAEAAHTLAEKFQLRETRKIYHGILKGSLSVTKGIWNKPLTDKAEGRKNPQGQTKDRIECETHFELITSNAYFSLCQFQLITGRQHQIRKHSALAKHPLVGDTRYNDPQYNTKINQLYNKQRLFLHCSEIQIAHHVFNSELPQDFMDLLKK